MKFILFRRKYSFLPFVKPNVVHFTFKFGLVFWNFKKEFPFHFVFHWNHTKHKTNIFSDCGQSKNVKWKLHSQKTTRPAFSKYWNHKTAGFLFEWEMRWKNRYFSVTDCNILCPNMVLFDVWIDPSPIEIDIFEIGSLFNLFSIRWLSDFSKIAIAIYFDSNFISKIGGFFFLWPLDSWLPTKTVEVCLLFAESFTWIVKDKLTSQTIHHSRTTHYTPQTSNSVHECVSV